MRPDEVRQYVQHRPFVPFRIRLTNGTTYDILHPGLCILGHHTLHVGLPDVPADPFADRVVSIAIIHITELIPLTPGLVA